MEPNFLNMTSAEMHDHFERKRRTDPATIAKNDQLQATLAESERVAAANSGNTDDPKVADAIRRALSGFGGEPVMRAVPVVRIEPGYPGRQSVQVRTNAQPLTSNAPVQYCNMCVAPTPSTVPFWYPAGVVVVQIDMCDACAEKYMERGHVPQLALDEPQ